MLTSVNNTTLLGWKRTGLWPKESDGARFTLSKAKEKKMEKHNLALESLIDFGSNSDSAAYWLWDSPQDTSLTVGSLFY